MEAAQKWISRLAARIFLAWLHMLAVSWLTMEANYSRLATPDISVVFQG